jgi:hypothetical protein
MTVPARSPVKGLTMSSILKVTVAQEPNKQWALLFSGDINDAFITPGEGESEEDFPRITEFMEYAFEMTRLAPNTMVDLRIIRFTLLRGSTLDDVVAGLLDLLVKYIGPRTFMVYMPR